MLLSDGRMILYHEALQKGNIDDEQKKELVSQQLSFGTS